MFVVATEWTEFGGKFMLWHSVFAYVNTSIAIYDNAVDTVNTSVSFVLLGNYVHLMGDSWAFCLINVKLEQMINFIDNKKIIAKAKYSVQLNSFQCVMHMRRWKKKFQSQFALPRFVCICKPNRTLVAVHNEWYITENEQDDAGRLPLNHCWLDFRFRMSLFFSVENELLTLVCHKNSETETTLKSCIALTHSVTNVRRTFKQTTTLLIFFLS